MKESTEKLIETVLIANDLGAIHVEAKQEVEQLASGVKSNVQTAIGAFNLLRKLLPKAQK